MGLPRCAMWFINPLYNLLAKLILLRPLEVDVVLWLLSQGLDGYSLVPQSMLVPSRV